MRFKATLREIDAKHFFGRESEFQRLVEKVYKATHTDDKVELVNLNKIELGLSNTHNNNNNNPSDLFYYYRPDGRKLPGLV
jgi:hypothetical protein